MERGSNIDMMEREYLLWLGINDTHENLKILTNYVNSTKDYSDFPDADIPYNKFMISVNEPSNFMDFVEKYS